MFARSVLWWFTLWKTKGAGVCSDLILGRHPPFCLPHHAVILKLKKKICGSSWNNVFETLISTCSFSYCTTFQGKCTLHETAYYTRLTGQNSVCPSFCAELKPSNHSFLSYIWNVDRLSFLEKRSTSKKVLQIKVQTGASKWWSTGSLGFFTNSIGKLLCYSILLKQHWGRIK